MKIAQKLGLAFVAVIGLAIVLGAVGVYNMRSIYARTLDITTVSIPSVQAVTLMRTTANLMRNFEGDHVLSADQDEMIAAEKSIDQTRASLQKQVADYAARTASPAEEQLYEESKKGLASYLVAQAQLLKLSQQREAETIATREVFRGDSRKAFTAYAATLDKLVEINNQGADASAANAEKTYNLARLVMAAAVLAGALLAAGLAVLILRDLSSILGGEPADARRFAKAVAGGKLNNAIHIKPGDTTSMLAAIKEMQESLGRVVRHVRQGSEAVAAAANQISQGNSDLSNRTEQQAAALEETAASMEELDSTVKNNVDNAHQANRLAQNASAVAIQGGEVVNRVVETMKGINDSSRKIADIIGVIEGIAFQTNILALNAAVEAARAGEQGRGFAVVASEVRSLAGRSAAAAKEIKTLIGANVERVQQGSALADQAGVTTTEVVASIKRVTDIMGEITAASAEQSAGLSQVGEAVTQMDQATQQNAALVEESAAAAQSMNIQAQQLVQAVAEFELDPSDLPPLSHTNLRLVKSVIHLDE